MTTIAADRSMIAGDSEVSYINNWSTQKIFRIGDALYGASGDPGGDLFMEWAGDGFRPKSKPNFLPIWDEVDFDILEVAADGLAVWDKHLVRMRLKDDNYSIGSGSRIALLLMRKYGLTPDQAVVECCEWDAYTKGPVDVLYLKEPKIILSEKEKRNGSSTKRREHSPGE